MKTFMRYLIALLGLIAAGLLNACGGGGAAESGKPVVVATIFCYYDAARAIGGDDIQPVILLPRGTSPHEYAPTPNDKVQVRHARLIVKNGLFLDPWIDKLAADNTTAVMLNIGDGIRTIETKQEALPGAATQESRPMTNPHVWLDPMNQITAAERIRDALLQLDPAHKAGYESRAATYIDELRKLDADFTAAAATFTHKEFIGFHSAYDYLARRYGLVQAAAIQELGEGGSNPDQIQKVIELIKQRHIPVVFTETAFDTRQADMVVKATGARLGTLQPLETYDDEKDTYVKLMRENLAQLVKTMK